MSAAATFAFEFLYPYGESVFRTEAIDLLDLRKRLQEYLKEVNRQLDHVEWEIQYIVRECSAPPS